MRPLSTINQILTQQGLWPWYQQHPDFRSIEHEAFLKALACNRSALGGRVYQCPGCGHYKEIGYTCKSKFCTSCGKKATDQWILTQQAVLPKGRWQQVTFTLPDDLWPLFKSNRALQGDLCRIAAHILLEMAHKKGVLIAVMAVIHTNGRDLKWNIHIHIAVMLKGLTLDYQRLKQVSFDRERVRQRFQARITQLLRENYPTLTLPPQLKQAGGHPPPPEGRGFHSEVKSLPLTGQCCSRPLTQSKGF